MNRTLCIFLADHQPPTISHSPMASWRFNPLRLTVQFPPSSRYAGNGVGRPPGAGRLGSWSRRGMRSGRPAGRAGRRAWSRWRSAGMRSRSWRGRSRRRPSSELERDLAEVFGPYHRAIDQGVSYRYYSTAFPPTPVVTATLTFADGRPEKVVRLPERGPRPRLDVPAPARPGPRPDGRFRARRSRSTDEYPRGDALDRAGWAAAPFATHLCRSNPGCSSVTLRLQMHLVPRIERVRQLLETPGAGPGRPRRRRVLHRPRTDRSLPVRRLLNGLGRLPVELARAIARGWDRFVFTPATRPRWA